MKTPPPLLVVATSAALLWLTAAASEAESAMEQRPKMFVDYLNGPLKGRKEERFLFKRQG